MEPPEVEEPIRVVKNYSRYARLVVCGVLRRSLSALAAAALGSASSMPFKGA